MAAKDVIYARAVGRQNPNLTCFYITTGNYEAPARIERLIQNSKDELESLNIFEPESIDIRMIGARALQQSYRAATTAVQAEIEFPKNVVLPQNESVEQGYIGYIDAKQVLELFTIKSEEGKITGINKSVFFDNIRDFDPNSKINAEISETLRNGDAKDFVFRNNGITVIAKTIDRTADRFRLEDFQIVNGCQTSNILFHCREHLDGLHVPFRLIGSDDADFVSSIIVGTNRQNPVRDEQFWALRPFMKDFEEYCRSVDKEEILYFERRENQYRGQQVERVRMVSSSTMMKAMAATFLYQPNRAARDYRGIVSEYHDQLFQDDHDVQIYHAACFADYRLNFLWRNQKVDASLKVYKFYILCAIGYLYLEGRDIFGLKANKISQISKEINGFVKAEDRLISFVEQVSNELAKRIKVLKLSEREKIRDAIRSDSFSIWFLSELKTKKWRGFLEQANKS